MTTEIVLPSEPGAAIDLFARAVAKSVGATITSSDRETPDRFLLNHGGSAFTLTLDRPELSVRVEKRGTTLGSVAYSLAESASPRPSRLRVLVAGGNTSDRRLRMTSKVIGEARGRNRPCEMLLAGVVPSDWPRAANPQQQFGELTPQETLRLVRASRCVLECGDELEAPTELALIALAAGVPVIAHRSSVITVRRPESAIAVDEWNADAFVDAIFGSMRDVALSGADPGAELLGIVERAGA